MDLAAKPRPIGLQDLAALGLDDIAYVRPDTVDGQRGFVIHAANGRPLGFAPSLALAQHIIRSNEMEPVSLH
jgi:hypothetical protein